MPEEIASTPSLGGRPVGEIVAEDYRRAAVLRRFGINFCCDGGRPLADACATRGVEVGRVEAALHNQDARVLSEGGPAPTDPSALVDYTKRVHHTWLRENLPALLHFTSRVAKVHGQHTPELHDIAECTRELAREMEAQMAHEEAELFPRVREIGPASAAAEGNGTQPEGSPANASEARGSIAADDLQSLRGAHEPAWVLMRELRELTGDFAPPEGACATWRAAYAKLEELEVDLHHHAELESKVLPGLLQA